MFVAWIPTNGVRSICSGRRSMGRRRTRMVFAISTHRAIGSKWSILAIAARSSAGFNTFVAEFVRILRELNSYEFSYEFSYGHMPRVSEIELHPIDADRGVFENPASLSEGNFVVGSELRIHMDQDKSLDLRVGGQLRDFLQAAVPGDFGHVGITVAEICLMEK